MFKHTVDRKRLVDPVELVYHSITLRTSDVQLLNGPKPLNDILLDFYYEYLEREKWKNNNDLLFFGAEVTQCMYLMYDDELISMVEGMNAANKPFIFFILSDNANCRSHSNHNGYSSSHAGSGSSSARSAVSHRSLLVFSRSEKKFFHFDSKGTRHSQLAAFFTKHICDVLKCSKADLKIMRCLQQNNDYDCGIHVICMTDKIADYINRFDCIEGVPGLQREVISIKRSDLKKLVKLCVGKPQKKK